jgi:hypothetical protein
MQWISVGSGIEHAEGGGTPEGDYMHGFQIWVNVPKEQKMADPRYVCFMFAVSHDLMASYGTEPPENIPLVEQEGASLRVLAGAVGDSHGMRLTYFLAHW